MKIAYIVYTDNGPFAFADAEHDSLLQFLKDKGLNIHKEAWADESVDWKQYDYIVLKSPWDYVEKPAEFYRWLEKMKELGIRLLNPADTVRWNCDKHYLKEIETAGLKVLPTAFIEKKIKFDAEEYFTSFKTDALIVKPCVSGASKNTFKIIRGDDSSTATINSILRSEAMMVQPFMPEINEEGEWSMVFFNGKFSHGLLKTPSKEDFRSQPQFGSAINGRQPSEETLASAQVYVSQFAKGCLYARVDGLVIKDEFYLMELELIDPYLFLSTCSDGYDNYYEALNELLFTQPHPML